MNGLAAVGGGAVCVTGMGVVCSLAPDVDAFGRALRHGRCGITRLVDRVPAETPVQVGAIIRDLDARELLEQRLRPEVAAVGRSRRILKNTTASTCWSACAAVEAWGSAGLGMLPGAGDGTGLIVGGCNLSLDYVASNWARMQSDLPGFNPRYGLSVWDSNQVGCLSELLGIRGPGFTVGAASASGNAALFQGWHWVASGMVERCLVVGAATPLSPLEFGALAAMGAAACGVLGRDPDRACRPFDRAHEGFVWGEGSAAMVLERQSTARGRGAPVLGTVRGASLVLDAHHLPDPSVEGEVRAMMSALEAAKLPPSAVGYVNAHGTSSPLGDRTEAEAIRRVFGIGGEVRVNATKGLVGHCLGAAGVVEAVATLVQLNRGFLHPNRNLEHPVADGIRFVGGHAESTGARVALSNGFGFGGFNGTLVLSGGDC